MWGRWQAPKRVGLIFTAILTITVVVSSVSSVQAGGMVSTSKKADAAASTNSPARTMKLPVSIDPPPTSSVFRGPVHAFAWNRVTRECVNITPMIWVTSRSDARYVAYLSRIRPPGKAVYIIDDLVERLLYHPEDAPRSPNGELTSYYTPWPTRGIEEVKDRVSTFFSDLASHRGRVDWIVMDNENYVGSWTLSSDHAQAIQDDPRSVDLKRRLGFDDFQSIFSFRSSSNYITWNAVLHEMVVEATNKAAFEPVQAIFPDVKGANFKAYTLTQEEMVPGFHGHRQHFLAQVGTHGSTSFYGRFGGLKFAKLDGKNAYGESPFAVLRWHLNLLRAICRSSDAPFTPWISYKSFNLSHFKDNAYYEEMIYHLILTGVDDLFYWNPHRPPYNAKNITYSDDSQDLIVETCLADVNARLGKKDRWCVTLSPIEWASPFLATGMRIGKNEILWRVTAPPEVKQMKIHTSGETVDLSNRAGFWYTSPTGESPRFDLIYADDPVQAAPAE